MRKMPQNPFQDRINALNLKDIEETLRADSYLKKSHDPIPDDINNQRFPMTDILPVNVLKPEELSMKDLLDQIQIQTILNNNTPPFIDKKIKSETTERMIKDFQNEISKPVEINGKFYKFRPPDVDLKIKDLPPELPDETTYKQGIKLVAEKEIRIGQDIDRKLRQLDDTVTKLIIDYDDGRLTGDEYRKSMNFYNAEGSKLTEAYKLHEQTMASLQKDYDNYEEIRLQYVADVENIKKENKQALTAYEDEIKSRNVGMEAPQREGESDADYAQRVIDTAQKTIDPSSVQIQAESYLYNSVKDRLNEVLPAYKSEAVLNTIVGFGGYEKLQPIKDQWGALKKMLETTFGEISKVENTDSIAQVLYNYSMKPTVRPAAPSVPSPFPPSTATVIPTPSQVPSYSLTTKPKSSTYLTKYLPTPTSYVPIPPAPPPPPQMSQYTSFADIQSGRKYPLPSVEIARKNVPKPSTQPSNPLAPTAHPQPSRTGVKSPTKSPSKTRDKLPMDVISYDFLRTVLDEKGLPFLSGNSSHSRKTNYKTALNAGLIPDRPELKPQSEVSRMDVNELQQYLASKGIRGANGGDPTKQKSKEVLMKMYTRYASEEMRGSGVSDIKERFAIVDGEIQAGNNNPVLIRDARKLLKEMVQQKLVTLYEAQKHMLHFRKINKI